MNANAKRRFNIDNEENTCMNTACEKPLRRYNDASHFWKYRRNVAVFGWRGNMFFCSKTCAAVYGIRKASATN